MPKNVVGDKKYIYVSILILSIGITILYISLNREPSIQVNSFIEQVGSVLGIQSISDRQARALRSSKIREASKFLFTSPNPISIIQIEGRPDSDINKQKSINSVSDMQKIYLLSYAYSQTSDVRYLSKSKEYMLSWVSTYKPSGNPIDESHLKSLFAGYLLIRDQLDRETVDKIDYWLTTIAEKELKTTYYDDRDSNNWTSNKIDIIGQVAYLTGNQEMIDLSIKLFKKHIEYNLYSDGSSMDFSTRDSLSYHCYNLIALLRYAKTAKLHGTDLYSYESNNRSSLKKSVHFLFPYLSGQKIHREFENSTIAWDKNTFESRSKNGSVGVNFKPTEALEVLETAYYFDDETLQYIQKILNNKSELPSFETMISYDQRQ